MSRRGENIRKRKDGRWEARVICDYDLTGKAKYLSLYGRTYQEVRKKRNKLIESNFNLPICADSSSQNKEKVTFEQIMNEWIVFKKDSIKESTFVCYTNLLEKHILPDLGEYYISALTTEIIDAFLKKLLHSGRMDGKGGLSTKTVTDIRSVILLGIEYARRHQYPCAVDTKVFYPRNRRPNIKVMSREEQIKLEEVLFAHPEPLELGILTALYGGLRIGEVCALQWGDFQFEKGIVQISKTMLRIQNKTSDCQKKTKILIDSPKTESSNRIIPMPTFIIVFLQEHCREQDTYILTGTKSYMEPRICLDKYKQVLEQAGLESFTFHALRHTFATRCVESGFDAKSLSEILGHANVNTTLQRYVHPSIELKKEQMERLEQISIWGQNQGQ